MLALKPLPGVKLVGRNAEIALEASLFLLYFAPPFFRAARQLTEHLEKLKLLAIPVSNVICQEIGNSYEPIIWAVISFNNCDAIRTNVDVTRFACFGGVKQQSV